MCERRVGARRAARSLTSCGAFSAGVSVAQRSPVSLAIAPVDAPGCAALSSARTLFMNTKYAEGARLGGSMS